MTIGIYFDQIFQKLSHNDFRMAFVGYREIAIIWFIGCECM